MKTMKTTICIIILFLTSTVIHSQTLSQTLKGRVTDKATQISLPGATIVAEGAGSFQGTTTDTNGNFRMEKLPVGRYTVTVSFIGYKSEVIAELLISSGKEVVLEVGLNELVSEISEIMVKAHNRKDRALNSMASISARSFTVEETRRYAGGMDDPARMASAFAGVATGNLQDNAIIIRGNSPKGVLWRVEGVEVPNPNHFSGGNVIGGGFVNIISSQVLANSDFFTGAFPAEYGNALAGVFDIKLRTGNSDKRESTFQIGMHGIDIASEGPFAKGKNASYLFNYRYSTFGLLAKVGAISSAQIPIYQDLSFKLNFPTRNAGIFSLWGMGGIDSMFDKAETDPDKWEHNMDRYNNDWNENFGAVGFNHKYIMGSKSYFNTSVVASGNNKLMEQQKLDDLLVLQNDMDLKDNTGKLTLSSFVNHKFSARHTNRTGVNFNTLFYNLDLSGATNDDAATYRNFVNESGNSYHLQFYTQSKYNFTDKFWLNFGIQSEYFALNQTFTIDPRIGLNWEFSYNQSISFGYGKHSQLENLKIYFINQPGNGAVNYPNKDLSFSHAHHFVLGYDWRIGENVRLKIEPYFQYLYDIPGIADSSFSMINFKQDFAFGEALENNSTGRNIGIDFTLERFLKNNFYYLVTASVFDSKYKADDKIWRNSRFDKEFVANFLVGKEFFIGQSKTNLLGINARLNMIGGNRTTPILQEESNAARRAIYDESRLFEEKEPFSNFLNLTITYRKNRNRYSSVWALQVNNLLGTPQNREYVYNYKNQQVEMLQDVFVLPGISYKIEF
jgi:hypothetical protein